jgi:capsular exopolysaccharide synthesis family protein
MNRIQQILSKAERDGTARRMTAVDDPAPVAGPGVGNDERPALAGPREIARPRHDPRRESEIRREAESRREADVRREPETARSIETSVIEPVAYSETPAAAQAAEAVLHPLLVAALEPLSAPAEHYRSLRSRIAQLERDHAVRAIQITSPGTGEGKTITALNLALTMAQEFQRRVLAIDADLRHPRMHQMLGLEPGPGLVDVLTGAASLQDALVELPSQHLTVLRAGGAYDRPAEMLGSAPMRRLLDSLRTQFDRIVIDSAPAVVADPAALAPAVDGLLLVVRSGVTTKPAIARAISSLGSPKLLGLVFNESGAPAEEPYRASA